MANLLDYINWFGDITFEQVRFNEVDNLILSQMSYICFSGVVPNIASDKRIKVSDASSAFFDIHSKEEIYDARGLVNPLTPFILQKMGEHKRWQNVELSSYESILDDVTHEQFAAICVHLTEKECYVAYRGTDDTLDGWQEDFSMSFEQVPAQKDALSYLEAIVAKYPEMTFMIGGHSKGGNLAEYACALSPQIVQDRVTTIWCNDSPGFSEDIVSGKALASVQNKIKLFVPQFCIVGALMQHDVKPVIVESTQSGAMQHDMFSWQVLGTHVVSVPCLDDGAVKLNQVFSDIIASHTLQERKQLTCAIFGALAASGATTVSGLTEIGTEGFKKILDAINHTDQKDRDTIRKIILALASATITSALSPVRQNIQQLIAYAKENPEDEPANIQEFKAWRETRHLRDIQNSLAKIFTPSENRAEASEEKSEPDSSSS